MRSMNARSILTVSALIAASVLTACSSVKLDNPPVVEDRTTPPAKPPVQQQPESQVNGVDLSNNVDPYAAEANGLAKVVYFDYDSYMVKAEFGPVLDGHTKLMNKDAQRKLVVQGHTDERGSREYNLALGTRRAEAVRKELVLRGVADARIEATSAGMEAPADPGHDEAAWAKNRRAELTYRR